MMWASIITLWIVISLLNLCVRAIPMDKWEKEVLEELLPLIEIILETDYAYNNESALQIGEQLVFHLEFGLRELREL